MDTYQELASGQISSRRAMERDYGDAAKIQAAPMLPLTNRIEDILNDLMGAAAQVVELQDSVLNRLFGRAPTNSLSGGLGSHSTAPESGVFEDRVTARLTELRTRLNEAMSQARTLNDRI